MRYTRLGRTGLSVSVLALGCWSFGGGPYWGDRDEAESIATIRGALDEGINFFDTAEAYGDGYTEVLLGKALTQRRPEAIVASKVSAAHLAPDDLRQACEASLRRLNTDYIDLYQIHWPNRERADRRHDGRPREPEAAGQDPRHRRQQLRRRGPERRAGRGPRREQPVALQPACGAPSSTRCCPSAGVTTWACSATARWRRACSRATTPVPTTSPTAGPARATSPTLVPAPATASRVARWRTFAPSLPSGRSPRQPGDVDGEPVAGLAAGAAGGDRGRRRGPQSDAAARQHPGRRSSTWTASASGYRQATAALKERLGPNPDLWQSESRYR